MVQGTCKEGGLSARVGRVTSFIPDVLAIGSCRIFRPLRCLHEANLINLVNGEHRYWFTHTASAAKQYVDVMQGNVHIPLRLREAALETELEWPEDMAMGLPGADLTIVEVSSLKDHIIDNIRLNAHKVYGIANQPGYDYRPIVQGDTKSLPDDHVLKTLQVARAADEQLTNDLQAIKEATQTPMMVVDHLFSVTPDGTPAPERVELTNLLDSVSGTIGLSFHSTRDLIVRHGMDVALEDHNHYRKEFENEVGQDLLNTMRKNIL